MTNEPVARDMRTKTLTSLGLLVCLTFGCTTSPHAPSPEFRSAGYVISATTPLSAPAWRPKTDQIAQLETKLGALMAAPDRRIKFSYDRERKCPFPLSDYAVRYHGETRGGGAVIVGKATHTSQRGADRILHPPSPPEESAVLETFGGGSYFFTVTYDVATSEVLEMRYNAPL